jgi:hypothetical protein
MRKKVNPSVYLILSALGLVAVLCGILLPESILPSGPRTGALSGIGGGLFAFGLANWLMGRRAEKHPEEARQNEIEVHDERNVAIRRRAQALSGNVLQWALMAAAWVCIFLEAPLWITLSFIGVFLGKTALELYLMSYYDKRM